MSLNTRSVFRRTPDVGTSTVDISRFHQRPVITEIAACDNYRAPTFRVMQEESLPRHRAELPVGGVTIH